MCFFTQAMTMQAGLILVAYCFKYAKMAGINQGCLPCIFSITIFYISILFWFKFNERISAMKIVGTVLMIPAIAFISLGAADSTEVGETESSTLIDDSETYTDEQKSLYAGISVTFALIAPFFWTTKAFYTRLSEDRFKFDLFDNAIDCAIY